MVLKVTFYVHRAHYEVAKTVSIELARIIEVVHVSAISTDVVWLLDPKPGMAIPDYSCQVTSRVRGGKEFITSYIKHVAMKTGAPVRLRL